MEDLLNNLTEQQLSAVTHYAGPCLVIAGAGTGKTSVVTRRIAYLIQEHKITPEKVLALTFTDKAAREMEDRVDQLLPYGLSGATISTFHSFCAELLKRHAFLIGIDPASKLMSSAEEVSFLRQHLSELPTKLYKASRNPVDFLRMLAQFLSKAKDEYLLPEAIISFAQKQILAARQSNDEGGEEEAAKLEELARIYATIQQLYTDHSVLSYADLIFHSLTLLQNFPSVRKAEQGRYQFLLVDEFQDTNFIQSEVARLLTNQEQNIMVVGDDDQAIYSFRGANLANIMQFTRTFPASRIITLADNFRSTQAILDTAYTLIQNNNPHRLEIQEKVNKRLLSHSQKPSLKPEHWHFDRGFFEYKAIAEKVCQLIKDEGYSPEDIAILVRSRSHARGIENIFQETKIPYQYSGDGKFYTLSVVQIALAFLRFLAEPHNNLNLFFLLTQAPFSLNSVLLQKYTTESNYLSLSLWEHLANLDPTTLEDQLIQAKDFLNQQIEKTQGLTPSKALVLYLQSSRWYTQLETEQDQRPLDQLSTLYQEIASYELSHRTTSIQEYIQYLDYLLATDEDISLQQANDLIPEGVQIMTIHKSKGLEFPIVFIPNLVQGRFPGRNYSDSFPFPYELRSQPSEVAPNNLPEERRLAYVAFTRAKEQLYLSSSDLYEDRKTKSKLSPFVVEAFQLNQAPQARTATHQELLQAEPTLPIITSKPTPKAIISLHHSASSLETYERCPLQYRYQYLLRIKVPNSNLSNFGTSIHETLRKWYQAQASNLEVDLETVYAQSWIKGGYESKEHEAEQYTYGLTQLKSYLGQITQPITIISLEQSVKARLSDGTLLSGKIDRIDQTEEGSLRIIDYKTSERPMKDKDASNHLPLGIYALALQQRGQKIKEVELHYVMVGEKVRVPIEQLNLQDIQNRAETIVAAIQESTTQDTFKAKPDKMICSYCDFRDICPFRYGRA